MKAVVQVSEIVSDYRWAREVRIFGMPVFLSREMNVQASTKDNRERIGFRTIGNDSLLNVEGNEE